MSEQRNGKRTVHVFMDGEPLGEWTVSRPATNAELDDLVAMWEPKSRVYHCDWVVDGGRIYLLADDVQRVAEAEGMPAMARWVHDLRWKVIGGRLTELVTWPEITADRVSRPRSRIARFLRRQR